MIFMEKSKKTQIGIAKTFIFVTFGQFQFVFFLRKLWNSLFLLRKINVFGSPRGRNLIKTMVFAISICVFCVFCLFFSGPSRPAFGQFQFVFWFSSGFGWFCFCYCLVRSGSCSGDREGYSAAKTIKILCFKKPHHVHFENWWFLFFLLWRLGRSNNSAVPAKMNEFFSVSLIHWDFVSFHTNEPRRNLFNIRHWVFNTEYWIFNIPDWIFNICYSIFNIQ